MGKIKANGISGSIVTNGTLLEKNDAERMVKMEWDLIRFSVDGLEETHDYLRGMRGSFERTLNAIKTFYDAKKSLKSKFPTVEINFVLTNKNYKELKELIGMLSAYDINFVYVLPMIELTEESKSLKISKTDVHEVVRFLTEAAETAKELGIGNNIEEVVKKNLFLYSNSMENIILEDKENLPYCFLPWYAMNINSDGSVTPCAQWAKSEGVKLDGRSLRRIWFEDFGVMRDKIQSRLPEWCSRCCVPLVDENKAIRKNLS
jgi:MoaA/NifB/PqqE/SkfB family radical SAM enzyme